MIEALIRLLTPIASLLDEKNKTKYLDEILKLKKEIADEELNQTPDDGRISYLHFELMRLSDVFANALKSEKIKI